MSSSKWHAWFASCCPGRCLSHYLANDCRLVSDSTRHSLWSADVSTCVVPWTLSSYGDRTYAAVKPHLWNSLPVQLHNPDITHGLFREQLKGHLFREARTRQSATVCKMRTDYGSEIVVLLRSRIWVFGQESWTDADWKFHNPLTSDCSAVCLCSCSRSSGPTGHI